MSILKATSRYFAAHCSFYDADGQFKSGYFCRLKVDDNGILRIYQDCALFHFRGCIDITCFPTNTVGETCAVHRTESGLLLEQPAVAFSTGNPDEDIVFSFEDEKERRIMMECILQFTRDDANGMFYGLE